MYIFGNFKCYGKTVDTSFKLVTPNQKIMATENGQKTYFSYLFARSNLLRASYANLADSNNLPTKTVQPAVRL